jgi:ABC-type transport system substrate-binding protein
MTRRHFDRGWAIVALAVAATAGCDLSGASLGQRPPRPLAGVHPGGTITIGITTPGSIDPAHVDDPSAAQLDSLICEPLMSFNPLTAKPEAGIATSWIQGSGGRNISVQLRHGVRYHSGQAVHSADLIAALSRVANVDTASVNAPLLKGVYGYDEIHGVTDASSDLALERLLGLVANSDDTFQILHSHNAGESSLLGHPISAPVPATLARRDDPSLATNPDCVGPYELTEPYRPGQTTVTLKRARGYYAKNQAHPRGGAGYPDSVVFKIFPDRNAELAAFRAGKLDIVQVPGTPLAPKDVAASSTLVSAANGHMDYVGFPEPDGTPFADRNVRLALSQALDRTVLAEVALSGAARPASGFIPPTVGDTYVDKACPTAVPPTADVSAAQQSLNAAKVDVRGKVLKLYFDDEFVNGKVAAAVAASWRTNLGVRVTLVPLDWKAFHARAISTAGFDGAFIDNWAAPYPAADHYLFPLFASTSIRQDNYTRYTSGDFDEAIDSARLTSDPATRALDYRALERGLCHDLPMAPLLFRDYRYLVRSSRVGSAIGSYTDAASGLINVRDLFVKAGN